MTANTHILTRHPDHLVVDEPCAETADQGTETLYPLRETDASLAIEKCLPRKSMLKLVGDHRGERIECLVGVLWITQTGNPDDILVCGGESFTITHTGTILIEGLVETILEITSQPARSGWRFPLNSL